MAEWRDDRAGDAGVFGKPSGKADVQKGRCLLVLPRSTYSQMVFAEGDGAKWVLVAKRGSTSKFPTDAFKSVADARPAAPDALGKVKLK